MSIKSTKTINREESMETKITVVKQGIPKVKDCYIIKKSKEIVALQVQLDARGYEILCTGLNPYNGKSIPMLYVRPMEQVGNALDETTKIEFPEYEDFVVWSESIAKDYIAICLVKI